ncbi:hypothetical protein DMENIID0001_144680 [Sergentomyia squamirostris]
MMTRGRAKEEEAVAPLPSQLPMQAVNPQDVPEVVITTQGGDKFVLRGISYHAQYGRKNSNKYENYQTTYTGVASTPKYLNVRRDFIWTAPVWGGGDNAAKTQS